MATEPQQQPDSSPQQAFKHRSRLGSVALIALLVIPVILLLAFHQDVSVAYYKWRMHANIDTALEVGPEDSHQGDYISRYQEYRDTLVTLGHYERREFRFQHIIVPSDQSTAFWKALQKQFPDNITFEMPGYEPETPDALIVWERPEAMSQWEEFVARWDVPEKSP